MSYAPDIAEILGMGLSRLASVLGALHDGVLVTTHCMYPSNGLVQVVVRGGTETVVASDEGGAFGEAASAGIPIAEHHKVLVHLIKDQGLLMKEGVIFYSPITNRSGTGCRAARRECVSGNRSLVLRAFKN